MNTLQFCIYQYTGNYFYNEINKLLSNECFGNL